MLDPSKSNELRYLLENSWIIVIKKPAPFSDAYAGVLNELFICFLVLKKDMYYS